MDKDTKVKVISTVLGGITVSLPNLSWIREWPRKGAAVMVPFGILEEGMYDTGFGIPDSLSTAVTVAVIFEVATFVLTPNVGAFVSNISNVAHSEPLVPSVRRAYSLSPLCKSATVTFAPAV